ncbi:hypothetical protein AMELA_G00243460 [Ameiurus melas]|uniref:Uncharacterized protein n=1 Tax=Ameiurus melas TaxID=219545 RepID=A0A7J5ZW34_AMEME|nr:hypothetical protein AMELA_G00243460 [Ameiurus melas]
MRRNAVSRCVDEHFSEFLLTSPAPSPARGYAARHPTAQPIRRRKPAYRLPPAIVISFCSHTQSGDGQIERKRRGERKRRRVEVCSKGTVIRRVYGMPCSGCSPRATHREPCRGVIGHWPGLGGA